MYIPDRVRKGRLGPWCKKEHFKTQLYKIELYDMFWDPIIYNGIIECVQ